MIPDHPEGAQLAMDWAPPKPQPSEQERELARVSGRIAESVLDFARQRLRSRREFRMSELTSFVLALHGGAPSSPDRVFRALRSSGQLRATLLSRTGSFYRVDGVEGA